VSCKSPTRQNQRHEKLFKKWLVNNVETSLHDGIEKLVFPIVLFTRAKWLKVQECCIPVFESGLALSWHLRRQTRNVILRQDQIEAVEKKIISAGPLVPLVKESLIKVLNEKEDQTGHNSSVSEKSLSAISSPEQVEVKQTKDGRKYVKVTGSKDEAEKVRNHYFNQGYKPSPVKSDRFTKGAWYFYLDDLPSG